MNRHGYQEILIKRLYPFILQTFQGRCFVHQENYPKHKSRLCMQTCLGNPNQILKTKLCKKAFFYIFLKKTVTIQDTGD